MAVKFPCELIGWFFLPALRRELVLYLIKEKRMSRKETARILGLTEAAICHYLKAKRGSKYRLRGLDLKKVRALGDSLAETADEKDLISGGCAICKHVRSKLLLCQLHAKQNPNLKNCSICWEAKDEKEEDLSRPWRQHAG